MVEGTKPASTLTHLLGVHPEQGEVHLVPWAVAIGLCRPGAENTTPYAVSSPPSCGHTLTVCQQSQEQPLGRHRGTCSRGGRKGSGLVEGKTLRHVFQRGKEGQRSGGGWSSRLGSAFALPQASDTRGLVWPRQINSKEGGTGPTDGRGGCDKCC